ncbi:hypothetical protein BRCON_2189 [Candidatus Sumerlaea chitinivorans]|uniref:Uncharacterized protein n=1 Tax=Sumerlaea chitinivorans TaxID=2250252 RepID=A0A2Z4Y7G3_SUMC1|nr:hypothetical protein BRCON_2189 [Candidatus Sumerlaea chitinivorans]
MLTGAVAALRAGALAAFTALMLRLRGLAVTSLRHCGKHRDTENRSKGKGKGKLLHRSISFVI